MQNMMTMATKEKKYHPMAHIEKFISSTGGSIEVLLKKNSIKGGQQSL